MDRHYKEGITWEEIRDAHEQDLKVQDDYGVKFLTYWFDPDRNTPFCLVDASDEHALTEAHQDAHGDIPGEIMPVDQEAVLSLMGRMADPMGEGEIRGETQIEPGFRAIMFTDIVGYTALTARIGDAESIKFLRTHNDLVRGALRRHAGNEVKHTGDGFMVSFLASQDAANAALDIQSEMRSYNETDPEYPVHLRIGIGAGEPIEEGGQFFGSSVNLASRLCDLASTDGIAVSQSVIDTLSSDLVTTELSGNETIKGFDQPIPVYRLVPEVA